MQFAPTCPKRLLCVVTALLAGSGIGYSVGTSAFAQPAAEPTLDPPQVIQAQDDVDNNRRDEIAINGAAGRETAGALVKLAEVLRRYASQPSAAGEDSRQRARQRALTAAEEARGIYERDKRWGDVVRCKGIQASLCRELNRVSDADREIREAMALYKSKEVEDAALLASLRLEFGWVLHKTGKTNEARVEWASALKEATDAARTVKDSKWLSQNIGKLTKAIDDHSKNNDPAATNDSGTGLEQIKKPLQRGKVEVISALRTASGVLSGEVDVGKVRKSLADTKTKLETARDELTVADKACHELFGTSGYRRNIYTARVKRAMAFVRLGEELLDEITKDPLSLGRALSSVKGRNELRAELFKKVDTKESLELAREALEIVLGVMEETAKNRTLLEQRWLEDDLEEYLGAYLSLVTIFPGSAKHEDSQRVYSLLMAWKGRVFTRRALLARHLGRNSREESRILGKKLQSLDSQIAVAVSEASQVSSEELFSLRGQRDALERELFQGLVSDPAAFDRLANLKTLENLLPPRTVLIDFFVFDEYAINNVGASVPTNESEWPTTPRLIAFVVPSAEETAAARGPTLVSFDIARVEEYVVKWRKSVASSERDQDDEESNAVLLSNEILTPLARYISGKHRILVSPAGPLNGVPLGVLPDPANPKKRLIERDENLDVAVVPAAALLVHARSNSLGSPMNSVLLVDSPDFGPARDQNSFKVLEPDRSLRDQIEKRFKLKRVLEPDQASKTEVLQLAQRQDVLFLRTHHRIRGRDDQPRGGAFDTATYFPGLNYELALTSANSDSAGILTGMEVMDVPIVASLVVLEACSSAEGDFDSNLGMQQSFQAAGGRTVLGTAWQVEQTAARYIVSGFLDNVKDARPTLALAKAQRRFLTEKPLGEGSTFSYYWGAWTVTDDLSWEPLGLSP